MNEKLKGLLEQLEGKESEVRSLVDEGKHVEAQEKLQEVRSLKTMIEVEKELANEIQVENRAAVKEEKEADKTMSMEYRTGFIKLVTGQKELMTESEIAELREVGTSNASAVVPSSILGEVQRLLYLWSPMRQLARVISSNSNLTIAMDGNVATAAWTGEASPIAESSPTIGGVQFNAYKLGALVKLSNELINDAVISVESYIAELIAEAFYKAESEAFIKGTGTAQPEGILSTTGLNGVSQPIGSVAGAASIAYKDVVALYTAINPKYRANGAFLISDAAFAQLLLMTDNTGRPLLVPDPTKNFVYTIFGRPVHIDPNMDALGLSKFPMAFADFRRAYAIVDRAGMSLMTSNERYFENDQVGIRAVKRTDARVMDKKAIAVLKMAAA